MTDKTRGAVRFPPDSARPRGVELCASYRSGTKATAGGVHDGADGVHAVLGSSKTFDCFDSNTSSSTSISVTRSASRCPAPVVCWCRRKAGRQCRNMAVEFGHGHDLGGHGRPEFRLMRCPITVGARPWTPTRRVDTTPASVAASFTSSVHFTVQLFSSGDLSGDLMSSLNPSSSPSAAADEVHAELAHHHERAAHVVLPMQG